MADEISRELLDGRIQRLGLIDQRTLAMEVYAGGVRQTLIASADSDEPRLLLSRQPLAIDSHLVTPFLLLLRKHVRGGRLVGVQQPPLERVILLSIAKGLRAHNDEIDPTDDDAIDDEGEFGATHTRIAVEIMGRHSNLILIDDQDRIMESAKRVTSRMSRVRPIAPRLRYTDPPIPTDRLDPRRVTTASLTMALATVPPSMTVERALSTICRGVSPQMAREVVFRALPAVDTTRAQVHDEAAVELAREVRRIVEPLITGTWAPVVYRREEIAVAFAALPQAHLAAAFAEERVPRISDAAAALVAPPEDDHPTKHAQRRQRLLDAIDQGVRRANAIRSSLLDEQEKMEQAERWRRWGEAIYGYLWQIAPGDAELTVDDETIPLLAGRSAKETAQDYFEQYRKATSAAAHVPAMLTTVDQDLAYLAQLRTLTGLATSFDLLDTLQAEWQGYAAAHGIGKHDAPVRRSTPRRRPRAISLPDGAIAFVGRSGAENDAVTFDLAGPNDLWLHARGLPGSHVILRVSDGREATPAAIETAAALAAFHSGARGGGRVEVDVTERRHVRKIKGAGPGMVTYRNERTLAVRPADERALGLTGDAA